MAAADASLGIVGGFARLESLAGPFEVGGFSLGIPPANKPPSCGGPADDALPPPELEETGGAPPIAPPMPPPPARDDFPAPSRTGPLLSFVTVFFNDFPAWICCSNALEAMSVYADQWNLRAL